MGIGAFVMGKVAGGGSLLGLVAATVICAAVGALVALPTIRLRDLYLALATFAFADAVANGFFTDTHIYGSGGVNVGRIVLPGLSFGGDSAEFLLVTVFFVLAAWMVLAIRRSLFGRRLVALNDSPAAYATVGLNIGVHQGGGVRHRRRHGRPGRRPLRHRPADGRHLRLRLLPRHHLRPVRHHLEHPHRVGRLPGRRHLRGPQPDVAERPRALRRGRDHPDRPGGQRHPRHRGPPDPPSRGSSGSAAAVGDEVGRRAASDARRWSGARPVPPADGPEPDDAVLTVSEVAVRFGGVSALSDVSLTVQPGTVTGLIGPNGAGKTTLFNVISGLQAPDRGTVHLFDTDVTAMKPHRRARLGSGPHLPAARAVRLAHRRGERPGRTGVDGQVVGRGAACAGCVPGRRRADDAPTAPIPPRRTEPMAVADLRPPARPGSASAGLGDRQRPPCPPGLARMVELARALAIGPKLLLLDEPGSGLDEAESAALGELLSELAAGGMAVLLVEHDMELVMRICDHIYVLDFGDIIASGTPDEIRHDPMVQAAYLGEAPGRTAGTAGAASSEADPVTGR